MLRYNKEELENYRKRKTVNLFYAQGLISLEEKKRLFLEFTTNCKESVFWVSVLQFIVTLIGLLSSLILIGLAGISSMHAAGVLLIVYSLITFFYLEKLANHTQLHLSAINNVVLLFGTGCMVLGMQLLTSASGEFLFEFITPLICLPILTLLTFRYYNHFLAIYSFLTSLYIIKTGLSYLGVTGLLLTPWILSVYAACILYYTLKIQKNTPSSLWNPLLTTISYLSSLALCFAASYYVVRQFASEISNNSYGASQEIPFAPVYIVYTFAAPVFLLYRGILKRQRVLIQVGLVATAIGVLGIRYYHHVLPTEVGLLVGGSALLLLCFVAYKRFKKPGSPISLEVKKENALLTLSKEIVTVETGNSQTKTAPENTSGFGGGNFGGGGAGSDY